MLLLYHTGRACLRLAFFTVSRLSVTGRENVPLAGPLLVSANHLSVVDPPILAMSVGRPVVFMAKEELFRSRVVGWFLGRLGAFPVHRGRLDREALRRAEEVLANGGALFIFPEGARKGQDHHMPEGYLGAAMIASRSDVPVLPMAISGTETFKGWGWIFRRPRISVRIGPPFRLRKEAGSRRSQLEQATQQIMQHINALLVGSDQPDKEMVDAVRS